MFAHRRLLNNERPDPLRNRAAKTLNALTPWAAAFIRVDSCPSVVTYPRSNSGAHTDQNLGYFTAPAAEKIRSSHASN